MSGPPRLLPPLLALCCLGLAARTRWAPPAPLVIVDPLAPPLTRIAALGDRSIGLPAAPPGPALGGAPQGPPLAGQGPPPAPPADPRGHALRVQVEADALALAELLGPEQLEWALAQRERLSATYAETAAWQELALRLQAPP